MECLFCKIINKKMKAEIIYEDNECIAFNDINPQAPIHLLIVPKEHIPTTLDIKEENQKLIGHLISVANKLAEERKIANRGFRLVVNCNPESGQVIYHLHLHLLGGRKMNWPPG